MKIGFKELYVGDFETTVYKGQTKTEVWASAIVKVGTEKVAIFGCIEDTIAYLTSLRRDICLEYHNAKFDGSFYLYYFITHPEWALAYNEGWIGERFMPRMSYRYSISSMGVFYNLIFKTRYGYSIEIRDSLKVLTGNVEEIGKAFKTKHQKKSMRYEGYRYPNCYITPEEKEYIRNDVLVIAEALEIFVSKGYTSMTIGSCAIKVYREMCKDYLDIFINLKEIKCPFDDNTAEEYLRRFYKGAFTYLKPEKAGKILENGLTLDVTSLYPSVMHSKSGFRYPIGKPHFIREMPDKFDDELYYFIHIKCSFELRKGYLPTIQIKGHPMYKGNEWLETSAIKKDKKYYKKVKAFGHEFTNVVDLYFTQWDWYLFKEHYIIHDFEFIDGAIFFTKIGIFDDYINHFIEIKNTSEGAMRAIAKYFLNNLYGKLASSDRSSYKVAYLNDSGGISYHVVEEHAKETIHVAIGAAITSHARYFTITHAQENYDTFCYADTDSLHLECGLSAVKKCVIANNQLLTWKHESSWDKAIFLRQKVYIEHINEQGEEYLVKCAGMSKRPKQLIRAALGEDMSKCWVENPLKDNELEFFENFRKLEDFKVGLTVPSNLKGRNIQGGILLVEKDITLR